MPKKRNKHQVDGQFFFIEFPNIKASFTASYRLLMFIYKSQQIETTPDWCEWALLGSFAHAGS